MKNTNQAWLFREGLRISLRGGIETVQDHEAIRQGLMLLLSTRPGERVMRPEYGCDLHRLIFSPNDETTAGLAIHYVRRAVERWEPRVEIVGIDAGPNPDRPGRLDIRLDYRIRSTRRTDRIEFPVHLTGERA